MFEWLTGICNNQSNNRNSRRVTSQLRNREDSIHSATIRKHNSNSSYNVYKDGPVGAPIADDQQVDESRVRLTDEPLLKDFGKNVFRGVVAAPYLKMVGLKPNTMDDAAWTTNLQADKVASALLHWGLDHGARLYCHWFQPLGAGFVRHGQSAQVQKFMFDFNDEGQPEWRFRGMDILKGESDGSSYPNGGLREPYAGGAYLTIDPTSPIFLRGDTIFIPACFVSFYGHALDQKTSLLRASDALTQEGSRLLRLLGYNVKTLTMMVGFEQELFFVPREASLTRLDLQLIGRTIMGKAGIRNQERKSHYMAPISLASPIMACLQEIQEQCFKLGIPLRTRHREAAPSQYELTPLYGPVTVAVDQNLVVMQIIQEVAVAHGLSALLQEKPFDDLSGSGKHNNWSISTDDGTNLFNYDDLAAKTGNPEIFVIIIAAIVKAVDTYGDLLRMAIATPGNDLRLGGFEAPSYIVSLTLGDSLTEYLRRYMLGSTEKYVPASRSYDVGAEAVPPFELPAEDRNRSSFLAFGGHRFEFRAVGSSQNLSFVNCILGTITAKVFHEFADAISMGQSARSIAVEALKHSWKVIFNGNAYDLEVQKQLKARGLWCIESSIDAYSVFTVQKNIDLFEELRVFTAEECYAQRSLMMNHYIGTVEIEAKCMIDMINQYIIPSCKRSKKGPIASLRVGVEKLQSALAVSSAIEDTTIKAKAFRDLRLITMREVRVFCDEAEAEVPSHFHLMATYQDLLYLDESFAIV